jgi:hypothetical protein
MSNGFSKKGAMHGPRSGDEFVLLRVAVGFILLAAALAYFIAIWK